MNKKNYEEISIEIILPTDSDIITSSFDGESDDWSWNS